MMKTKSFRLLTVLLASVMLIALSLNVMAAKSNAVTKDGLTAQLVTDKDSYKEGESVKASVQVDNHTGEKVYVITQMTAPDGVVLEHENVAFDTFLENGESWEAVGGAVTSAGNVSTVGSSTATGDNMQAAFWVILTTLAVCGMIALFVYGKNKKTWISVLLCMAMIGGMAMAAVPAYAADLNGTIELSCTILVDGKDAEVTATVSYVIYDDEHAPEVTEETEVIEATEIPTEEPTTTVVPTTVPMVVPSPTPTVAPSPTPTVAPSPTPTVVPSPTPTVVPSPTPTVAPTPTPTIEPTETPVGTTVFVNRTFDETNKTEFEEITVTENDNKIEVVKGNSYLKLTKVDDAKSTKIQYNLNDTVKYFVAESKFSTDENGVDVGRLFIGSGTNSTDGTATPAYLYLLADGSVTLPDKTTVVAKIEAGKWVKLAVAVNLNDQIYDVYVDDRLAADDVAIEKEIVKQPVTITAMDAKTGKTGAVLMVDDIKVYEGLAPEGITIQPENVWVEETLVNRTFDETDKEALAEIAFNSIANKAEVVKGGNYLKMYRVQGGGQPQITLAGPGSNEDYANIKSLVVECDASTDSVVPNCRFIWGRNSAGTTVSFMSLATSGKITSNSQEVGCVTKGSWLSVAVVIDLEAKTYTAYANKSTTPITGAINVDINKDDLINNFESLCFRLRNNSDITADLLLDNVRIYEGTTPWTDIYANGFNGIVLEDHTFEGENPLNGLAISGDKPDKGDYVNVVSADSHLSLTKTTDSAEDLAQIQYQTNNNAKDLTKLTVTGEFSTKNGVDAGSIFKAGDVTYLYLNADGTVTLPESEAYKTVNDDKLVGIIKADEWLKLTMEADLEAKTYKIWANDEAMTGDLPLPNADSITELPSVMTTGFNAGTGKTDSDIMIGSLKVTGKALRESTGTEVGDTVFVNRTFDEANKEAFAEITTYTNNKTEVIKGNNYLSMSKTSDSAVTQIQYYLNNTVKCFVAECDLSSINGMDTGVLFGNSSVESSAYLYLTADGKVTLPDKTTVVANVTSDKWVNVAIAVDLNTQTYDVYVDGAMTHENIALPTATETQPVMVTCLTTGTGNTGKELLIDDLKVYEGTVPREIEDEKEEESYVKKLIYLANSVVEGYLGDMKAVQLNANTLYASRAKTQATQAIEFAEGKVYLAEADIRTLFGTSATLTDAHPTVTGYYDVDATAAANGYNRHELEDRLLLYSKGTISLTEEKVTEVNKYMQFDRPKAETVLSLHNETIGTAHPRILVTQSDVDRIKELYNAGDTYIKTWGDNAIAAADKAIADQATKGGALYSYRITGSSMDDVADVFPMLTNTGMAYFITGDTKYAQAAWIEIENICKLEHWNPASYLDVGELSAIVGLGYDWFYNYLSTEQKAFVEDALISKGLQIQYDIYNGRYKNNDEVYWTWWDNTNNWNAVCNGGCMIGAIAVMDKYPELCSEVISHSLRGLEFMMTSYFPEGAWHEGGGYWRYALEYLAFTLASFDNAFNDDFGFLCSPGLESTGWFGLKLSGSTAINNYGDSALSFFDNEAVLWCADVYTDAELAAARIQEIERQGYIGDAFDMVFYNAELLNGASVTIPLDTVLESMSVVSLRERWYDKGATFLGFSGMKPKSGHAHMDTGTFVVDMLGERIIMDVGAEDYNSAGYFGTDRYKYYRARPEGHNIYIINPTNDADDYGGFTPWVQAANTPVVSKARGAYSALDLSQVYAEDTTSAIRGYFLGDDRRSVTVRDEIVLKAESEIYSFLHTEADVEFVDGDKNTAILTLNGKKFKVSIVVAGDGVSEYTFSDVEAKSMYDYGVTDSSNAALGIHKLQIYVKASGAVSITMKIIGYDDPAADDAVNTTSIANWSADMIEDGEAPVLPTLDMIYVDGTPIKSFDPTVTGYASRLSSTASLPTVTASSSIYSRIEVEPATEFGKDYVIKVYDNSEDDLYRVYRVSFTRLPALEPVDGMTRFPVKAVTACCIQQEAEGHVPENVIDNDFIQSRWTAESADENDGHTITLELDSVSKVKKIGFAFYSGNKRDTFFKVDVSPDGITWTEVFNGQSPSDDRTAELRYFYESDTGIDAKYVRFTGYGNTKNGWNNITEFVVLGD